MVRRSILSFKIAPLPSLLEIHGHLTVASAQWGWETLPCWGGQFEPEVLSLSCGRQVFNL